MQRMRALQIDFIKDKRWRWVWAVGAVSALVLLALTFWKWQYAHQTLREFDDRIGGFTQQAAQMNAVQPVVVDARQASSEQAAKILQQDLNKVFASTENLKEMGVRLRNLNLDSPAGTLRLEFELDSLPRAASLTAVLNGGYDNRPWQLESVTGANATNTMGIPSAQTLRGLWSVDLRKL